MKSILLFCNPDSGDGAHSEKILEQQIRESGFGCKVFNHSEEISDLSDTDLFAVAGGDGTIRKFLLQLLDRPVRCLRPIGLLPLGTANNISKTLRIKDSTDSKKQIASWKKARQAPFDIGMATGSDQRHFFAESMGYGIFPKLMKKMGKVSKSSIQTTEEEFETAFKMLYTITERYRARACRIEIDGKKYAGKYLMVELMNIKNLGSNMCLAPKAEPDDGWMDIVLVPESGRSKLLAYIEKLRTRPNSPFPFKTIRAREVAVTWSGKIAHIDDDTISLNKSKRFEVRLLNQLIQFLR
jgi:diacylglycerol kinase (ATP)